MIIAALLLAQATPNDSFVYSKRQCGKLVGGLGPVHWGIAKSECAEIAKMDVELNSAYRKRYDGLPPGSRTALRQSQRDWLARMSATCGLSGDPIINNESSATCFRREVKKRIAELLRFSRV